MIVSKKSSVTFIKFYISLSLLCILLTIIISELVFHNFILNDFIKLIQTSASNSVGSLDDHKVSILTHRLLYYAYISMAISSVICLALFTIFIVLVSKNYIWPINRLCKMISQMTKNIYVEIDDQFPYEINTLKNHFNMLSKSLRQQEEIKLNIVKNISHELKTPLTTIQGLLEGSLDHVIELDQDSICIMLSEINRLKFLLNDIEDSTYDYKSTLCLEWFSSNSFINELIQLLSPICTAKSITITCTINDNIPQLYADAKRLQQVLINILTNSIKYSPNNSKIEIALSKHTNKQYIYIQDNGYGIPIDEIPYIFERFYRGEKSRSRKTGGAGIGLSIVKNIVEAHNGTIEVKSILNQGTTMCIILPFYT